MSPNKIIEEFYSSVKEEYSDISLEEFKIICKSSWKYLRQCMEGEDFPEVRFKYFGVFKVKLGRAKFLLKKVEKDFKKDYLTKERYEKIKLNLINYITTYEN